LEGFVKQAFCSLCAIIVLTLAGAALCTVRAQTPSATPEPFVIQLTSSPAAFSSSAGDISGNGRFVVFESNGDVATEKTAARNNSDGNREIFIADYGQRRIFQITNTKNVPKTAASPTPTPTPSPTPTPTASPVPTPADPAQVQIEVSNNRPMISFAPSLNGNRNRVYTIVFSSNAPDPRNFDGVDTGNALAADGNQEVWIYQLPEVADVDLASGADLPLLDLSNGVFIRITNTPASRVPSPGATGVPPFVADDNRSASISDNGNIIALVSTRNLVTAVGNTDGNPEVFFFNRTTSAFTQVTNTQDIVESGRLVYSVFNENPSLSADGSVFAFISNADLAGNNNDGNNRGNAEVYVANFNGATVSGLRQATLTKGEANGATVNLLSQGRRLSRDGSQLALESRAEDPKANAATNQPFLAIFVYNLAADTFVRVGTRATGFPGDIIHFPTFTDYNNTLTPSTLVFASALNFKTDGTFPAADQTSTGLNPSNVSQVFATQVPATSTNTFTRLTRSPQIATGGSFGGIRPLASDARKRIAFSLAGAELGGGNADNSGEVFYLLSPASNTEPSAVLSFFTGASNIPLPAPVASPSPSPSPIVGTATGLAAGVLGIIRSTVAFAPSDQTATGGSEATRSPALPVELKGVSVSVNGAAAGLYFVSQTSKQINFVVPIGVSTGSATVVISSNINSGTQIRDSVLIVAAQPDIFTTTGDAGGRAAVVKASTRTGEPFSVTSTDMSGAIVPTELEVSLTGVRGATTAEVKVTVGTTEITGDSIVAVMPNPAMPGWDLINFKLPASLAGAGDVPIIVTVTRGGVAFSSRPADSAPHITISP